MRRGLPDSAGWAAIVFAVAVVAAVPVIIHTNREQWFFLDEWDFLADRSLTSPHDLLRPHNDHWSTIPVVLYRSVWQGAGLHHYWPYQMLTIVGHLATAILLRLVMRRAGADPWIATAAAGLFLFFGTGREDIGWGFQIGFTGALAFGLGHLVLADHDGPMDRRDLAGMGCGLASLMCSGIGVPMVVAVGAAVLMRRGWRTAFAHTAPLALVFGLWYLGYGHESRDAPLRVGGDTLRLVRNMVDATVSGLGGSRGVGLVVVALTVVGLVLAVRNQTLDQTRRTYAATAGLLVGAVVLVAMTSLGRGNFSTAAASRYLYLLAALLLPAIVAGLTSLAARWRPFAAVALVLLIAGLPTNLDRLTPRGEQRFLLGTPQVLALANSPNLEHAPRSLRPAGPLGYEITAGWLIDARRDGKVPPTPESVRPWLPSAGLRLSLAPLLQRAGHACRPVPVGRPVTLGTGEVLRVPAEQVTLVEMRHGAPTTASASFTARPQVGEEFAPGAGGEPEIRVRAVQAPLVLAVDATGGRGPAEICRR